MSDDTHRAVTGRRLARLLLEAGAVQVSTGAPFVLAAGWASPVYVDCRRLIDRPATRRSIVDLAVATLHRHPLAEFEVVAGAETAGIAWAAFLAERLDLPLRYVRRRPLGSGRQAQVEGGPVLGRRVLLVDDLTTDGRSKQAFAQGLRQAGAVVEDVLTLFHHAVFPGSRARLAGLGLRLHALASWEDLLALDPDQGLAPPERAVLQSFLQDPAAWSLRQGGRGPAEAPG